MLCRNEDKSLPTTSRGSLVSDWTEEAAALAGAPLVSASFAVATTSLHVDAGRVRGTVACLRATHRAQDGPTVVTRQRLIPRGSSQPRYTHVERKSLRFRRTGLRTRLVSRRTKHETVEAPT